MPMRNFSTLTTKNDWKMPRIFCKRLTGCFSSPQARNGFSRLFARMFYRLSENTFSVLSPLDDTFFRCFPRPQLIIDTVHGVDTEAMKISKSKSKPEIECQIF